MNTKLIVSYTALIAIQDALFGQLPNSLRAITLAVNQTNVNLFFYHHGEISQDDRDLLMVDVAQDYGGIISGSIASRKLDFWVDCQEELIRLDEPIPIPKTGYLAYKRYEPGKFDQGDYLFPENIKDNLVEIYGAFTGPLVFIASQKALLNRVEENLRKVRVAWDVTNMWLHFYYDNDLTDLNRSLAHAAAQEFMESFSDLKLNLKILLSDELEKYASERDWLAVFSRGNIKKS